MKSQLNILHLEDDAYDSVLVEQALKEGGIRSITTNVQNETDFVSALERGGIDIVLLDFALPTFDGFAATAIVRARWPDLPVILVSGTLGEEIAIDSLKNGATDYVLKERLERLVPAVRNAMHQFDSIAERRRLELQYIEAQKMEIVGQLAGGVAHDFNNLLSVIMGYNDLLSLHLDAEGPLSQYTKEISKAVHRGKSLTREILVFSRREVVSFVVLDLNRVVQDLNGLLRLLMPENVEIIFILDENLGNINADPGYLGQVLMNMAVNARDAMPSGGKLTIATRNVVLDESSSRFLPKLASGRYVVLSVNDNGRGMSERVKEHIFDAFYTTKAKGNGTGLGLSTCQTLVKQAGGYIDVISKIGKGTTFEMYFPEDERALQISRPENENGPTPGGSEPILVVEDDPFVRNMARILLEKEGYEVRVAKDGMDAVALIAARDKNNPLRLVFTDMMMPLLDGQELAAKLLITNPEIKILFTSGYIGGSDSYNALVDSGASFIGKPYSSSELKRKIREMLDS
jgi:two-component system, cell cycle sensor histidine kinase and response regulator CckA